MAYEIPKQLEYEEKIFFNLTFKQIVLICIFMPFMILAIKSNLNIIFVYWFLVPLLVTMMIGFAFFDMMQFCKYMFFFLRNIVIEQDSDDMNDLIPISRIDDYKITILQNKTSGVKKEKRICVFKVMPIDFDILNDESKKDTLKCFEKLLNSLNNSIQIVVLTDSLVLDFTRQNHKINQNIADYAQLCSSYRVFLDDYIKKNHLRNKEFFVILEEFRNIDVESLIFSDNLKNLQIKPYLLKNDELIYFYRKFYNRENKTNMHYDFDSDKKSGFENKQAITHFTGPLKITGRLDYIKIDNRFYRTVIVKGYPRSVEPGFISTIIANNENIDMSFHIEPFKIEDVMIMLNRQIIKQRADLYAYTLNNSINPSLQIQHNDTLNVLESLQKGDERLFNITLSFSIHSDKKSEMDYLTEKVITSLNSVMLLCDVEKFRQAENYKINSPIRHNPVKNNKKNITSRALSAFFPFTSRFMENDEYGSLFGVNSNMIPIIRDVFKLPNANGLILSTSGGGKSYFSKLFLLRNFMMGTNIIIIDPQGEYMGITEYAKGKNIEISKEKKSIINPLDLLSQTYMQKRMSLLELFAIMLGELTFAQRTVLDKNLKEVYDLYGIFDESYESKKMPILEDLYKILEKNYKKASKMEQYSYESLINRLYIYVYGVFSFLNAQTSVNISDEAWINFDISKIHKQLKPVMMFIILEEIYTRMKKNSSVKKILLIDEAWLLINNSSDANYIFEIVKTCRKFNLGILLVTQDLEDLINSYNARAIITNISYTVLLKQKSAGIEMLSKMFNLSEKECNILKMADVGQGILILDNRHEALNIIASENEHRIITTNPNEKFYSKKYPLSRKEDCKIKIDTSKNVFESLMLTCEEKNYLMSTGFGIGNFVGLNDRRYKEYFVKTNNVESIEHTFLVEQLREYIQNKGYKVDVNVVKDADIIFYDKSKRLIAIEIETGKMFKFRKKSLLLKLHNLKLKYDKFYIVTTSYQVQKRYKIFLGSKSEIYNRKTIVEKLDMIL